jgi:hypothetical protein
MMSFSYCCCSRISCRDSWRAGSAARGLWTTDWMDGKERDVRSGGGGGASCDAAVCWEGLR